MEITAAHLIYFSATGTTERIISAIGGGTGICKSTKHPLLNQKESGITIAGSELAIFGVPVYSGRVPAIVAEQLLKFRGKATPAIIAAVYGNRDFDDALIELRDIVESYGFRVVSAGAFIAQHSIFPAVGQSRPDSNDIQAAAYFGKKSIEILLHCHSTNDLPAIEVRGNSPYRKVATIPLRPKASKRCNECGACAKGCPTGAINPITPRKTDKALCISCAHCISICPQKARNFGGLLYKLVAKKFIKNCSKPQIPYIVCR